MKAEVIDVIDLNDIEDELGVSCALCAILNPEHRRVFGQKYEIRDHAAVHARQGRTQLRRTLERCFPEWAAVNPGELAEEEPPADPVPTPSPAPSSKPRPPDTRDLGPVIPGYLDVNRPTWSPQFAAELVALKAQMTVTLQNNEAVMCTCGFRVEPGRSPSDALGGTRLSRITAHLLSEAHMRRPLVFCALCRHPFSPNTDTRRIHFQNAHFGEEPMIFDPREALEPELRREIATNFPAYSIQAVEAEEFGPLIQGVPDRKMPWSTKFKVELERAYQHMLKILDSGGHVKCGGCDDYSTESLAGSSAKKLDSPELFRICAHILSARHLHLRQLVCGACRTLVSYSSAGATAAHFAKHHPDSQPCYYDLRTAKEPVVRRLMAEYFPEFRQANPDFDHPASDSPASNSARSPKKQRTEAPTPTSKSSKKRTPKTPVDQTVTDRTPARQTLVHEPVSTPKTERTPARRAQPSPTRGSTTKKRDARQTLVRDPRPVSATKSAAPSVGIRNGWTEALEDVKQTYQDNRLACCFPGCGWGRRFQGKAAKAHAVSHAQAEGLYECRACAQPLHLTSDARMHLALCPSPRIAFVGEMDRLLGVLELCFPDGFRADEEEALGSFTVEEEPSRTQEHEESSPIKEPPKAEPDESRDSSGTLAARPPSDTSGSDALPPPLQDYKAALAAVANRLVGLGVVCAQCGPVGPALHNPVTVIVTLEVHLLQAHLYKNGYECGVCSLSQTDIIGHFQSTPDHVGLPIRYRDLRPAFRDQLHYSLL